jgi:hypothetical protein
VAGPMKATWQEWVLFIAFMIALANLLWRVA